MTTAFPGNLDSFTNPTSSDTLDSATVPHAAQHDNLNDAVLAVETALGTNLSKVGVLANANTFTASPQQVTIGTAANVGLIVKGAASQTANLQQNQNSGGTVLSGINAAGQIYAGTTAAVVGSSATTLSSAAYTSATVAVFTYGGTSLIAAGQTVTVAGVTGGTYNGTWVVSAATTTTFTVLGSGFTNVAGSGGTVKISANLSVVASSTAQTPLVVQGIASQNANIFEVQSSAGTSLASVTSAGSINISSNALVSGVIYGNSGNGSQLKPNNNNANTLNSGSIQISGFQSNHLPLLVKQAALSSGTITAATANGTTVTYTTTASTNFVAGQTVTITGVVSTGNPGATAGAGFNLTGATIATASTTQFTVTNALSDTYTSGGTATIAAQTADLTQWQSSAGTVTAKIAQDGRIYSITTITAGSTSSAPGLLNAISTSAGQIGIIAKGAASQTGDLQQWQNSGGTVLASVTSAGVITANQPTPTAKTANATLTVAELLTGIITSTSATAVALTLPTGTLMDGGFATLANNMSFDWSVINLGSASGAVTMTAGATHTYVGNATVAINTSGQFRSRRVSATTWETYRIA